MFKSIKRNKFHASALAVAISLLPFGAYAAGLGKVTVLSPLGQPLRAELDVTATREELSSMAAKVASPDAFKQAGIDYATAMTGIRLALDKRPNGQPFLRMTSDRPINDPFLDVLVELTWSSGRMMREYTVLLDPPEALKVAPAPVAAPEVKTPTTRAPTRPAEPPAMPSPVASPPTKPARAESVAAAPKQPAEQGGHTIKRGDTLSKIAGEVKPDGVSLDQMLVALFRNNQDAFEGGNMNRLRTGKILTIPDQAAAATVSPSEAHKIVLSQGNDFNAYRQKLAGAVASAPAAKEEAPKQEAAGKIVPKVEEKPAAPASAKDKLEVSRTETAKDSKAVQSRITSLEEDLVARDKALKDASSRIAELEKNLGDLKKLAELKSQAGAQLQQQAQAAKPAPAPVPAAPASTPAPAPVPVPAPEAKKAEPASAPLEVPKSAEKPAEVVPVPAPAKPEEAIAPAPKPVEAAPAPVEPPKPAPEPVKAQPAVPAAEPSFMDDNALLVYGGGGVLALLLGYLGYSSMRRKRAGDAVPTTSRITEGDLMANSVFGSTGGQAVDTGASIQTDFSQSNLTSIDADEGVDPVAEADVYMAYGRDAQAEEILIDALKNDPTRHAIHLKLLEIYSSRKSVKQFESLATDLYGQTSGTGPDWEKAATMGRALDPDNSLYGGKPAEPGTEEAVPARDLTTLVVPPSEVEKLRETVAMPGQLGVMAATATAAAELEPPAAMDFDLDLGSTADTDTDVSATKETTPLDLNLELPSIDGGSMDATTPMGLRMSEPALAPESSGLDFEFDLDAAMPSTADTATDVGTGSASKMDLSSIDLDLATSSEPDVAASDQDDPDVTTKIELAQAYEEMGDKEGARELLQEVVQEGSVRQKDIARNKLALLEA